MNCTKYKYKSKLQKETWLKNAKYKYYHVIGDPELNTNFYFDEVNNILFVKTKDDYNSLPQKVVSSFEAVKNTMRFKYIFKTDDDQNLLYDSNIFFNNIMSNLNTQLIKSHYGGNIINITQPYISKYYSIHPELPKNLEILPTKYCSGRFYYISFEGVNDLIVKKKLIYKEYLEDYAIGYFLNNMFKQNIIHLNTDEYFKDFK